MRKFILLCASLFTMVLLLSVSPVMAQTSWVGPNGSDANLCGQTSPCATFQRAISAGGTTINCLGSGSYGSVTITASITIDCGTGSVGNIVLASSNGITLNTSAAATIVLRHLTLDGRTQGLTVNGISGTFFSGSLTVEDCTIQGYNAGFGILFQPQSGRGLLQVSNTSISGNGVGVSVVPASNHIASVTLNRVELVGNVNSGLGLSGGVVAGAMRDSLVGSNGGDGVIAQASQVFFTVEESSIIANLGIGIHASSAGAAIKVGASTIGANGTGVLATSGSLVSFGNNQISDNGVDGNFTSTTALK
jgi:hypothetical protein